MAAITDTRSFVRAVQDLFGVERLREHQQSTLRALLDGRDVFLSVRTGGGKSLCYMGFPAAAKALAKAETEPEMGYAVFVLSTWVENAGNTTLWALQTGSCHSCLWALPGM
ncbi:hypothetical protein Bbelb_259680 [Branchiostoma belcheri]|nr:hypothetical protein Bbelb_259680 [Branchiostoma belcheri]